MLGQVTDKGGRPPAAALPRGRLWSQLRGEVPRRLGDRESPHLVQLHGWAERMPLGEGRALQIHFLLPSRVALCFLPHSLVPCPPHPLPPFPRITSLFIPFSHSPPLLFPLAFPLSPTLSFSTFPLFLFLLPSLPPSESRKVGCDCWSPALCWLLRRGDKCSLCEQVFSCLLRFWSKSNSQPKGLVPAVCQETLVIHFSLP